MDKNLKNLIEKRNEYRAKLIEMNKHFRGVKHENALSELKYSEIKVYEDFVSSLDEEIANIKKN
jgi:flagellar biosynthesis chaperone FliJ